MSPAKKSNKAMSEPKAPQTPKKPRRPSRLAQTLGKVGFIRRWQIRRMLKFIDKSKADGKRLPPEFYEMERFLQQNRVPKAKRASVLEEAMTAQDEGVSFSRDHRRAAAAQQRRSGKGAGKSRPGLPPGAIQQGRRKRP